MSVLSTLNGLFIHQKKEWTQIMTGFESKNRYAIFDTNGTELFHAMEKKKSIFLRIFLRALRPWEIVIQDPNNQTILTIKRPFHFYLHEIDVFAGENQYLGKIKRHFSVFCNRYSVFDTNNQKIFTLFGPFLHPWTFEIRTDDKKVHGKIVKKWSGLLKEGFTAADNFGITFPAEWDDKLKLLFLGGVFLVDFVHFESRR